MPSVRPHIEFQSATDVSIVRPDPSPPGLTPRLLHSAVFYWDKNNLKKVADLGDVKKMTKRVNGGYNGLAHRTELLNKANGLLAMLDI